MQLNKRVKLSEMAPEKVVRQGHRTRLPFGTYVDEPDIIQTDTGFRMIMMNGPIEIFRGPEADSEEAAVEAGRADMKTARPGLYRNIFGAESLQIQSRSDLTEAPPEGRRSTRPLKKHREAATKFLEVRKAIEEIEQQGAAIRAIAAEKQSVAGSLAAELMSYAEEYQDRTIQTEQILLKLQDIPPHKAAIPQWKKVIDHLLNRLESVSTDMRKEAEAFIEASKSEIPGRTELMYQELESTGKSVMGEAWVGLRKLLDKMKAIGGQARAKLDSIVNDARELLGSMEGAGVSARR